MVSADSEIVTFLKSLPRRALRRGSEVKDAWAAIQAAGLPVTENARHEVHTFVNQLQQRRGERRRTARRVCRKLIKDIPTAELERRKNTARTKFAQQVIQQELNYRENAAPSLRSFQIAPFLNCIAMGHVASVYKGSHAASTKKLYRTLESLGWEGAIAAELLRCQKASTRAKAYRGHQYTGHAYERKSQSLHGLCRLLSASDCAFKWGWKPDSEQPIAPWVLYIELPTGQVSFHSRCRFDGPDYLSDWDRSAESERRIIGFAQSLLDAVSADSATKEGGSAILSADSATNKN